MLTSPDPARVEAVRERLSTRVRGAPVPPGREVIRRGLLLRAPEPDQADREALLGRILAVERTSRKARIYVLLSAAAVLGLPIVGRWPSYVECLSQKRAKGDKGRAPGIHFRRAQVQPEPVEFAGLLLTSTPRTVIDLARTMPLEGSLAAADFALHHGWCSAQDLRAEAALIPRGGRGRRTALLVSELADGRAESVGESLSRARMYALRVPRPQLQVVRTAACDRPDFYWERARLAGEFDGKVKYGLLPGQTQQAAVDALFDEKRREDRLRAAGDGVLRWDWSDAYDLGRFERVMRGAGLLPGVGLEDWPCWPSGPLNR